MYAEYKEAKGYSAPLTFHTTQNVQRNVYQYLNKTA
jgi:hypothetical protein